MLIVADSGSTSIDWRIIGDNGSATAVRTAGVNPVFQGVDEIAQVFREAFGTMAQEDFALYFYGAGVLSPAASAVIREAVAQVAPRAGVQVGSDLEAVGVVHFGDGEGIVGILGTGSNAGIYNKGRVLESVPAGGFILGDEGSGAYMGKRLLGDYIKGVMPDDLRCVFEERYALGYADIVQKVYREAMPSRFLASFCPFLKEHIGHGYVAALVESAFEAYFERNLQRYAHSGFPLGIVGSIAVEFEEPLLRVAWTRGFADVRLARTAADGLESYYRGAKESFSFSAL